MSEQLSASNVDRPAIFKLVKWTSNTLLLDGSWVRCVWVFAAIAVDVPSASVVVVAMAIKTKIDIFLSVVFMLTPEQR
jgi:hypothetical protein